MIYTIFQKYKEENERKIIFKKLTDFEIEENKRFEMKRRGEEMIERNSRKQKLMAKESENLLPSKVLAS